MRATVLNVILGAVAMVASGCAISDQPNLLPQSESWLDGSIDRKLQEFCPIPADTTANRATRARVVLAAITGYAYRSIERYSSPADAKDDAVRSIGRIKKAYLSVDELAKSTANSMFPVYRVDSIVDLAEAAEAAARPTLRAGKDLLIPSMLICT